MEEVDGLVNALDRIGSPFLQTRRPGLSPDELRAEVLQHMPQWWADYIDDQVCAWYGWQHGANPETVKAGGEPWQGSCVITPNGLALVGIHEMLMEGWEIAGLDYARTLGIVFPLGQLDSDAAEVFLHKSAPADEWTVCYHWLESGLQKLYMGDGHTTPPTFREWLTALTDAINAGRFVLGKYGNVNVPGDGIKRTSAHFYPWKG